MLSSILVSASIQSLSLQQSNKCFGHFKPTSFTNYGLKNKPTRKIISIKSRATRLVTSIKRLVTEFNKRVEKLFEPVDRWVERLVTSVQHLSIKTLFLRFGLFITASSLLIATFDKTAASVLLRSAIYALGVSYAADWLLSRPLIAEHFVFPLLQFGFSLRLPKKSNSEINSIVQKVVRKSGLKHKVKVYVLNSKVANANAFSVSGPTGFTAITVTQGLIDSNSKKEFEAVIAHECAHIYYEDCSRGSVMGSFLTCISAMLASTVGMKDQRQSEEQIKNEQKNLIEKMLDVFQQNKRSKISLLLIPIATFTVIAELMYLLDKAVSRRMEYRADEFAAKIVGERHTISMLQKLKPVDPIGKVVERVIDFYEYKQVHPTTDNRINAIRKASYSPLIRWG
jgi:Zn-dependent protease with chaperone function